MGKSLPQGRRGASAPAPVRRLPSLRHGYYSFSSLLNWVNNTPNTFQQAYGPQNGNVAWDTDLWSGYVNDSYRVSSRLTVDVGLRYDYEATPRPPSNAFPQYPQFLTQIKDDKNNFAPRIGFAWDVSATAVPFFVAAAASSSNTCRTSCWRARFRASAERC